MDPLMLVVAVTALAMGGGVWGYRMWRLSCYYAGRVEVAQADERSLRQLAIRYVNASQRTQDGSLADHQRNIAAHLTELANTHAYLARIYERAARYPWLPVEPDPPEP
jgi:hypothetical protein